MLATKRPYNILITDDDTGCRESLCDIVEKVVIGMFKGVSFDASILLVKGGFLATLLVGLIVAVSLIPFFAFIEIRRVLGPSEMRRLLFTNRRTWRAV